MKDHQKGFRHEEEHHRHGHHHRGEGFGRSEGFGRGGRGGKMRRGEARYLILDALRGGPKHGYEIIKALEERSAGQYAPSPGTVYPTLQFLEELGLVGANQDADRRIYHLTERGIAELETRAEEINAFWSRFQEPNTSSTGQAELGFLQEEMQYLEQTVWRVVRAASGPNDHETIRRVRQAVEQCRNEVRRIITEPSN